MKALKSLFIYSTILGSIGFFALSSMNSINSNEFSFKKNNLNIKFAKRIDEVHGKITIGRTAASIPKMQPMNKKVESKIVEKVAIVKPAKKYIDMRDIIARKDGANLRAFSGPSNVSDQAKLAQESNVPAPAVRDDLDLQLTGGLYGKQPLENGKDYNGSAKVVDGIIEEVYASFPDGRELKINTGEKMVGNVFEYQDSETSELKSGLFYEVKKGTYMITLTDDTNFAGLRLEFQTQGGETFANDSEAQNWSLNKQNNNEELAQQESEDNIPANEFNEVADSYNDVDQVSDQGEEVGFNFSK